MSKSVLEQCTIQPGASIKEGIQRLNDTALQILLVVDRENRLMGTVTDGDIRRGILANVNLHANVQAVMNADPVSVYAGEEEKAAIYIRENGYRAVPIVDSNRQVVDLVHWKDLKEGSRGSGAARQSVPVFILAGGKGTRMRPVTNILPKPLIPIGETPIVEIIMQRFQRHGFHRFIMSLNFKADMIRLYFSDSASQYDVEFVQEEKYLGTAGSLHLIKGKVSETVIVSNCDVLLEADFSDFLDYHRKSKNHATIIGVLRHVAIPYGVMEMERGQLASFREKPEMDFIINSGIYALEPEILDRLEENTYADMPVVLQRAQENGYRVGVYPISSKMVDIGHWDEYRLAAQTLGAEYQSTERGADRV